MKYPEQTDNYDVDVFNGNFLELEMEKAVLAQDLQEEVSRAKAAEQSNADSISTEAARAQEREQGIESSLFAEAQSIRQLVDTVYANANGYTDTKIAGLIGGAPSTLDTLGEITQAMQDNAGVVAALDEAIGQKAGAAELDSHVKDKGNPHGVTKAQIGLGNVGNYKAVSTSAAQGLSDAEKANARNNIGAGTSSFSGNYNDLSNKPAIPSVPASLPANGGNADTVDGVHFAWFGQSGQPDWLWGSNNGVNTYVWKPSNFSVSYAGSAGNADTVDGFSASQSASSPNTCVVRDANGYTNLHYINSNTANNENPSISQVIVTNGDNYYRKASLAHLKGQMGLGNVNNTADSNKSVYYASSAGYADSAGRVAYGNVTGRPTFSLSGSTLYINF